MKVAPMSTIHPSKRANSTSEPLTNQAVISVPLSCDSEDSVEGNSSGDLEAAPGESPRKRATRQSTKSAAKLVSSHSLSTRKTSRVLQIPAEDGVCVPTPS